jgi:hypothetical protein
MFGERDPLLALARDIFGAFVTQIQGKKAIIHAVQNSTNTFFL